MVTATDRERRMEYDFFVSHAQEDKILVARPLAHALRAAGCAVWYDEFSLRIGDSLLASIDHGLISSRFGVVVLSPSFFAKRWTRNELAGLTAGENGIDRRVLPIWHHIDAQGVFDYSPILADRVAVSTEKGIYRICESLLEATFPDRVKALPLSPDLGMRGADLDAVKATLAEMLAREAPREDILLLLSVYHSLLRSIRPYWPIVLPGYKFGEPAPDFLLIEQHGITGPINLCLVFLGPVADDSHIGKLIREIENVIGDNEEFVGQPSNDYLGPPYAGHYPSILHMVRRAIEILNPSDDELRNIHLRKPEVWSFEVIVLIGRRMNSSPDLRAEAAARLPCRTDIISYDRLTDPSS